MFLKEKISFESLSFKVFYNTVPSLYERLKKETFCNVWFPGKIEVCAKCGTHKHYKVNLVTQGPLGPSKRALLRTLLRPSLKWRAKEQLRKEPFLKAPLRTTLAYMPVVKKRIKKRTSQKWTRLEQWRLWRFKLW